MSEEKIVPQAADDGANTVLNKERELVALTVCFNCIEVGLKSTERQEVETLVLFLYVH